MASTLAYRTETPTARDHFARIAAASRVAAERVRAERKEAEREARALKSATAQVEAWIADGAVEVGHKIYVADGGKWRGSVSIAGAAEFIAFVSTCDLYDGAEFWAVRADGSYVEDVW